MLEREGVTATFFVIPRHITEDTADIVRRAGDDGHMIALHSHTRGMLLKSRDELSQLLDDQADEIERLSGHRPCPLFRPHAGWRGGELYAGLDRAGYTLAGWSFGMWDWNWWRAARPERLARRLADRASDGDIVVMHDGHHTNPRADRQRTVQATAELIPLLKARGFRFGNLCEATRKSSMSSRSWTGNGERGTGNGERGTGTGNGERRRERGTGNRER